MTASASSIRVVPATGQRITGVGKYRFIAMLAEGGLADVYLAAKHASLVIAAIAVAGVVLLSGVVAIVSKKSSPRMAAASASAAT